ncbi:MAG: type I-E CRISPR-associated protein Cse1/CasA, partial [Elusimicrobiales bacterium]
IMENKFNLVDEKWIPLEGGKDVSLKDIFENKEKLPNLRGNPIQKISLIKFLLAVVHSAYTPKDQKEWEKLGPNGMAEKTLKYLESKKDLFYLYGEKPFLQMPQIKKEIEEDTKEKNKNPKEIGNGDFPNLPNDNNTIIFDRDFISDINSAQKTIFIISSLSFALAGKQHHSNHNKPSKVGPSLGRNCYLHSIILGEYLLDTIYLNWLSEEDIKKFPFIKGIGTPTWEKVITIDKSKILNENHELEYQEILLPISRLFYLYENGTYMMAGKIYPNFKEGWRELTLCFNSDKILNTDTNKKPWREITALLSFIDTTYKGYDCPQIRLAIDKAKSKSYENIKIFSGGLKVSSDPFGQKVKGSDDFIESEIIINLNWLGKKWFERLKLKMEEINDVSKELNKKVYNFYKEQKLQNPKELASKSENHFWQLVEKDFNKLLEICNLSDDKYEEESQNIRKIFIKYALNCYDIFCPHDTARQIESWAKNMPIFKGGKKDGK